MRITNISRMVRSFETCKSSMVETYTDELTLHSKSSGNKQHSLNLTPPPSLPTTSIDLTNYTIQPIPNNSYLKSNIDQESIYSSRIDDNFIDLLSLRDGLMTDLNTPNIPTHIMKTLPNPFEYYVNSNSKLNHDKQFFIFTSAGKPIFSMNGEEELVMGLIGVIHTVLNYFQVNNNSSIYSIVTGESSKTYQRFVFLNKDHLILMAMTARNELADDLVQQLDLLYSYLISSLSKRQLMKLFENRPNFDLRNFLSETDMKNLLNLSSSICQGNHPGWSLNALECLSVPSSVRNKIHEIMLNSLKDIKLGTLLYGLITAPDHRLVSIMRPKKHTLHTMDLQLLFSLLETQLNLVDDNQECWIPICFPKFNSNGFLHCYIKFLPNNSLTDVKLTLILISPQKDSFFQLRNISNNIIQELIKFKLLDRINSITRFSINEIPASSVYHFTYKSKKHIQYVMPDLPTSTVDWNLLTQYYSHIKYTLIEDSGKSLNKSLLGFIKWDNTAITMQQNQDLLDIIGFGWITPIFELYLLCNNGNIDRKNILQNARNIVHWCKKNEGRMFVLDGAMF